MSQQTVAAQDMIARFAEGKEESSVGCQCHVRQREFRMVIGAGHHRMHAQRQRCARNLANTPGFVDTTRMKEGGGTFRGTQ
jgi:hypothetical protein